MSDTEFVLKPKAMRDTLLQAILEEMAKSDDIFFATADFGSPVLDSIRSEFPNRFVNVGIAEQNLINVSSGLALEGYKVFAYAIAPFLTMRCFEQIRVNLALMSVVRKINVNLIGVGAGYSYVVSGPTHQCYEDISLMSTLPNVDVLSPSDHLSSEKLLPYCIENHGIKYIRLDAQVLPAVESTVCSDLMNDGFRTVSHGSDIVIIGTGYCTHTCIKVARNLSDIGVSCRVIDIARISSFNEARLLTEIGSCNRIISLEEGFQGKAGLDTKLMRLFNNKKDINFLGLGVSNGYNFELGTREELHEHAGIGAITVTNRIRAFLEVAL